MREYFLAPGQTVVLLGDEGAAAAVVDVALSRGHHPTLVVAVRTHGRGFEFALDCGACGTVCATRDGSIEPARCHRPDQEGDEDGPPAQCEIAQAVFEVFWRHDNDDLLRAAHIASLAKWA